MRSRVKERLCQYEIVLKPKAKAQALLNGESQPDQHNRISSQPRKITTQDVTVKDQSFMDLQQLKISFTKAQETQKFKVSMVKKEDCLHNPYTDDKETTDVKKCKQFAKPAVDQSHRRMLVRLLQLK